jgi:predicted GIY-YIG superfamily endonuclease
MTSIEPARWKNQWFRNLLDAKANQYGITTDVQRRYAQHLAGHWRKVHAFSPAVAVAWMA